MKRTKRHLLLQGTAALLLTGPLLSAQETPPAPGTGVTLPEESFPGAPPLPPEMPPEPSERPAPVEIPVETAIPMDPAASSAAQEAADTEYLRQFSLTNAQTRTGFHSAVGNADRFFQGFGGVPHPAFSDLLPIGRPSVFEMRIGPVKVKPQVSTGVVVSKISGRDARTQVEANETVAFQAELGDPLTGRFLAVNYGLGFLFGENRRRTTDLDQSLSVLGQYDFDKLRLGMGLQYSSSSGDDREFTETTHRQVLTLSLTSTYQWTERTSFDADLTVPITEYSSGLGSGGVTGTLFANYAFTPKTLFGLGVSAGYLKVEESETQVFEQVLVRVLSTVNPYFLYYATVGVDFRDFGKGKHVVHPVLAIGGTWTPREGTSVSLIGESRVQNSASISNADFLSTSVTLTLSQRLGGRATAYLSLGYEHADYQGTEPGEDADRTDNTFFGQFAFSLALSRRCNLLGTLTYRDTKSDAEGQSDKQAGLQISYAF